MEVDNSTFAIGDAQEFKRSVDDVSKSFGKLAGSIKLAGAEVSEIRKFSEQIGKVQTYFQKLEVTLGHYLGSMTDAKKVTSELFSFSAWAPFSVENITEGALALASYGVDSENIVEVLSHLGDIATGLSVPLNDLAHLYGSMVNEGKLSLDILDKFTSHGIPMIQELSSALGVAENNMRSFTGQGGVGIVDVTKAIERMTGQSGAFYQEMLRQSGTLIRLIEQMNTVWNDMADSMKALSVNNMGKDVETVAGKFNELNEMVKTVTATSGSFKSVLSALSAGATAHGENFDVFSAKILGSAKALNVFRGLAKANIYATMAVELFNVISAVWQFCSAMDFSTSSTKRVKEATDNYNKSIEVERVEIDLLFSRLKNAKVGTDEWYKAKEMIINKYGGYLKGMNDEIRLLKDIDGAYKAISQSAIQSAKDRALADGMKNAGDTYVKEWSENMLNIQKRFIGKFDEKEGQELFERLRDSLANNVEFDKELTAKINEFYEGRNHYDHNDIETYIDNIKKAQKAYENTNQNLKSVFTIAETPFDPLNASLQQLHEELPKAKVKLEDLLNTEGATAENIAFQEANISLIEEKIEEKREGLKQIAGLNEEIRRINNEINSLEGGTDDPAYAGLVEKRKKLEDRLPKMETGKTRNELLEEERRYNEAVRQEDLRAKRAKEDIMNQAEQEEINSMNDGFQKKQAQMKLNHAMEIQQLKREEDDFSQQKRDAARAAHELNPDKKKGEFNDSSINLTAEEKSAFNNKKDEITKKHKSENDAYALEIKKMEEEITAYKKEELARQLDDIDKYYDEELKKVEGQQQLIDALNEKRAKEKKDTEVKHDIKVNSRKEDLKLAQTDSKFSGTGMTEYAEREKTAIMLKAAKERIGLLRELNTKESHHEADMLQETATAYKAALNKPMTPKGLLDEKVFKSLEKQFENVGDKTKSAEQKTTEFLQGVQSGGQIASEAIGSMKSAFGGMDEGLDMAMDAAAGIAQGFAEGGLVGGISAAAGQLINVSMNMLSAKREMDQSLVDYYANYVQILSDLIDKNIALLDKLGGSAFESTISSTIHAINEQFKASRHLLDEAAKSNSSAWTHSLGYRANKMLKDYKKELRSIGILTTDWSEMTDEQLMSLKQLPEVYAKLPDKMRKYIDEMIAANDQLEDLSNQLRDMIFEFDAGDITSAIVDSLTDSSIDNAMDELGGKINNFLGSVIKNLIVRNGLISAVEPLINNLINNIAHKDAQGNITGFKNAADISGSVLTDFKNGVLDVAEGFKTQWDVISQTMKEAGIDLDNSDGSSSSQEASRRNFSSMSQDTGDELNGRFTSLQMSGVNLEQYALARNEMLNAMNMNIGLIGMSVDEIRDINRQSMNHLYKIEKNTALLHSTNELLGKVVNNTANL